MAKTSITAIRLGLVLLGIIASGFFVLVLPRLLILNSTSHSDYIVVLDGHDPNYYRGLKLLESGLAPRMFVCLDLPDVPLDSREVQADLAFVKKTAGSFSVLIDVCKNDSEDALSELVGQLGSSRGQRVLIVTPASESRVQFILAKRRFPHISWFVDPSPDRDFDVHWWRNREWTDTYLRSLGRLFDVFRGPASSAMSVQRSIE